jgi:hypothetical protein
MSGGGGAEARVYTPSIGNYRYPDVHIQTPDGQNIYIQVGRALKDGSPVAREWGAIGDLTETGTVIWVPYR